MSWSVSATGRVTEVSDRLKAQFAEIKVQDPGEAETVSRVSNLILQTLSTFDSARGVTVNAHGHMGYNDWPSKRGPYQSMNLSIIPQGA